MRTVRTFFRLLRLGLRPSHAARLALAWGCLLRFWWLWALLILAAWFIFQSVK